MTLYTSISPTDTALAQRCVDVLEALGKTATQKYGRFIVSLAGGSTPKAIYRQWAKSTQTDWSKVVLVFGDERCVPPDHAESNYRMVKESLLDHLPAEPMVLRISGEKESAREAAAEYDRQLNEVLGKDGRIHVALLGLGRDGHTASLFPSLNKALREGTARCVATRDPSGKSERVTLSVPTLREAHKRMFIVSGSPKQNALLAVLEGPLDPEKFPAQFFLRDERLNTNLMLDFDAAELLERRY